MKTEEMMVTPALARDWLKFNTGNRALRLSEVGHLKSAFERGEYIQSHQGVAFSEARVIDGVVTMRLLDGQHRLSAIAAMADGVEFKMQVCFGVDEAAFKIIDKGIKRTSSDSLFKSKKLTEVARLAAQLCTGSAKPTDQLMSPYVFAIEELHEFLIEGSKSSAKNFSSAPMRLAAIASILNGASRDYVKSVYSALVKNDYDNMPQVAKVLVRSSIAGKLNSNNRGDFISRAIVVLDPRKSNNSSIRIENAEFYLQFIRDAFSSI